MMRIDRDLWQCRLWKMYKPLDVPNFIQMEMFMRLEATRRHLESVNILHCLK
jgi:hypothetical protein